MAHDTSIKPSKVSPAYLNAIATSHTWPFSAIAELIDNAYDPDAGASVLSINAEQISGVWCLTFTDNGQGMSPEVLYEMLSFGFSNKPTDKSRAPIGQYGSGFKSGSMNLGKDAVVFTKSKKGISSVGMLSQTYLDAVNADTVLVPMISWDAKNHIEASQLPDLDQILKYSLFHSEEDFEKQFNALQQYKTGTRIVIYNLKRTSGGLFELNFTSKPDDIINSESAMRDIPADDRVVKDYTPEYHRSLREYCSILFLKPKMKIYLRGQKVKTRLVEHDLSQTEKDVYRPRWLPRGIKIVFGFQPEGSQDYGIMFYYRNRLIKAYERTSCQNSGIGIGVVGVVKCDFLEPVHNKQDFNRTDQYNHLMHNLDKKLKEYWHEKTQGGVVANTVRRQEDYTWVMCDMCQKWRRLPEVVHKDSLPDKWFCYMNKDMSYNRCELEEEELEEGEKNVLKPYKKTFHKKQQINLSKAALKQAKRIAENALRSIEISSESEDEDQPQVVATGLVTKSSTVTEDVGSQEVRHSVADVPRIRHHASNASSFSRKRNGVTDTPTHTSPVSSFSRHSLAKKKKPWEPRVALQGQDFTVTTNDVGDSAESGNEDSIIKQEPARRKRAKDSNGEIIVIDAVSGDEASSSVEEEARFIDGASTSAAAHVEKAEEDVKAPESNERENEALRAHLAEARHKLTNLRHDVYQLLKLVSSELIVEDVAQIDTIIKNMIVNMSQEGAGGGGLVGGNADSDGIEFDEDDDDVIMVSHEPGRSKSAVDTVSLQGQALTCCNSSRSVAASSSEATAAASKVKHSSTLSQSVSNVQVQQPIITATVGATTRPADSAALHPRTTCSSQAVLRQLHTTGSVPLSTANSVSISGLVKEEPVMIVSSSQSTVISCNTATHISSRPHVPRLPVVAPSVRQPPLVSAPPPPALPPSNPARFAHVHTPLIATVSSTSAGVRAKPR